MTINDAIQKIVDGDAKYARRPGDDYVIGIGRTSEIVYYCQPHMCEKTIRYWPPKAQQLHITVDHLLSDTWEVFGVLPLKRPLCNCVPGG